MKGLRRWSRIWLPLTALAALAAVQCRPGTLSEGDPRDPCFCGTFTLPRDAGRFDFNLHAYESGRLIAGVLEARDLPDHPWQALLFDGVATTPDGTATGTATLFFGYSESLGEYVERTVPGVTLTLSPRDGACTERTTLHLDLSYVEPADGQRNESYTLERSATCPESGG